MVILGLTSLQQNTLDNHLSGGRQSMNGLILNALATGVVESFQGKLLASNVTNVWTYASASLDKDNEPYYVQGSMQTFTVRLSDTTAVTAAGFPDASASTDRGFLRLTLRDVNGVAGMGLHQESQLWIAPTTSFSLVFDIAKWSQASYASGVAFWECGVVGDQATANDIATATKEPGDGNPFIALKFSAGRGQLRVRTAASATVLTSGMFDVATPTSPFTLRFEYKYNTQAATGYTVVYMDEKKVASVAGAVTGPFQIFTRVCHGASYAAATHTPIVVDVDSIICSVPRV